MSGSVSMIDGHIDEELKPCPNCRRNVPPGFEVRKFGLIRKRWRYRRICFRCLLATGYEKSMDDADEAWNRMVSL